MDRKKRKLGEIDSSAQPASAAANDKSDGQDKPEADTQPLSAPKVQQQEPKAQQQEPSVKGPKLSVRASKKARKQKEGIKTATNPKQQLVRTVALGNLASGTKAQAVAMAQAAGKVLKLTC